MDDPETSDHEFYVNDRVRIVCHDEGYTGRVGVIDAVFPSRRCLASVGPITLLNIPPEGIEKADND